MNRIHKVSHINMTDIIPTWHYFCEHNISTYTYCKHNILFTCHVDFDYQIFEDNVTHYHANIPALLLLSPCSKWPVHSLIHSGWGEHVNRDGSKSQSSICWAYGGYIPAAKLQLDGISPPPYWAVELSSPGERWGARVWGGESQLCLRFVFITQVCALKQINTLH